MVLDPDQKPSLHADRENSRFPTANEPLRLSVLSSPNATPGLRGRGDFAGRSRRGVTSCQTQPAVPALNLVRQGTLPG